MTAREYVSQVRSSHKFLSADQSLTDRLILSILVKNRNFLANQRLNERKLWQTDSLFTNLCLELEQVPLAECCNYTSDIQITRTKYQLPKINEGIYNYAIKGIYNVETSKKFSEITPDRYINLLMLRTVKNQTYAWIYNNYIYTTNPNLEAIKLTAFFENHDLPKELLFPQCGCQKIKYDNTEYCTNPLDREFKFAGYLSQPLIDMTSKYLLETYHNIPQDKNSNNLDETSK